MALALNIFKTVTANITTSNTVVYTAPSSYTGIVLMAQITNITSNPANVTLIYSNNSTELLKDFTIPGNDAAAALTGKLIIETGQSISISSSVNDALKITASILESANE
jgi:hypothetical protein